MLYKLACCGDRDSADLMKGYDRDPELVMTLKNKHYSVTLLDAEASEVIGGSR